MGLRQSYRDSTLGALSAGARELIVEACILEVAQVEIERLVEDGDVDVDSEARTQDLARQGESALDAGGGDDQGELASDPLERDRGALLNDYVDDPFSRPGDAEGQERGSQRENAEDDREARR